jgi:hypothetical protein
MFVYKNIFDSMPNYTIYKNLTVVSVVLNRYILFLLILSNWNLEIAKI